MRSRYALAMLALLFVGCSRAQLPVAGPTLDAEVQVRDGWATTDDGVRLFYRVYGTRGDTILYLHGGPGGNAGRQMPNLVPLARRHVVVAYDQRGGNGQSETGDTLALTPARHVADVEAVRAAVGAAQVSLFGHSWGGALGLLYADAHPARVRRLIVNGPMPPARIPFDVQRNDSVAARVAARCAALARQAGTGPDGERECRGRPDATGRVYWADTANIARDRGRHFRTPSGPVAAVGNRVTLRAMGDWDFRPVMRRVRVPILVVEGTQSPVPLEHVRIWARTPPNARMLRVDGAGHAYGYIEQPERFFTAVERFLSGRWPAGAQRS